MNRSLKIPKVAHASLFQKGECWTWNQKLIRGLGSIPTRGNIFSEFYNPNLHNIARSDRIEFKTKTQMEAIR